MTSSHSFLTQAYNRFVLSPVMDGVLMVIVVTLLSLVAYNLPYPLQEPFKYIWVQFLVLWLCMWYISDDFIVTFIISFIMALILWLLRGRDQFEGPSNIILPGCINIKMDDLIKHFKGDVEKLKSTMYNIGVPINLALTDTNAPLFATYLVNYGYNFNDSCSAPGTDLHMKPLVVPPQLPRQHQEY